MNRPGFTFPSSAEQQHDVSTLADCLSRFLRVAGLSRMMKCPRLCAAWQETVGEEISGHTRVWGFRKGLLEIAVDSSPLVNEIQFHRKALLCDMRSRVKEPFISQLSFLLRPTEEHDAE